MKGVPADGSETEKAFSRFSCFRKLTNPECEFIFKDSSCKFEKDHLR